jgi:hypothetical protein
LRGILIGSHSPPLCSPSPVLHTEKRPKLWLVDSVKGMELSTSCITLSKHEKKEFCGFLKIVKVPSDYSTNVSRLISFPDLKVAPDVKSHDYHVLLTQMIIVGICNILPVNVQEAIRNFCFFFNAIGQKVGEMGLNF